MTSQDRVHIIDVPYLLTTCLDKGADIVKAILLSQQFDPRVNDIMALELSPGTLTTMPLGYSQSIIMLRSFQLVRVIFGSMPGVPDIR